MMLAGVGNIGSIFMMEFGRIAYFTWRCVWNDSPRPQREKSLLSTQVPPRIIKYEKLCVILHYHHHLPIYVHSWKFSSIFFFEKG